MSRRVVYHALAELELNDAAQYYERECHGLGAALPLHSPLHGQAPRNPDSGGDESETTAVLLGWSPMTIGPTLHAPDGRPVHDPGRGRG